MMFHWRPLETQGLWNIGERQNKGPVIGAPCGGAGPRDFQVPSLFSPNQAGGLDLISQSECVDWKKSTCEARLVHDLTQIKE